VSSFLNLATVGVVGTLFVGGACTQRGPNVQGSVDVIGADCSRVTSRFGDWTGKQVTVRESGRMVAAIPLRSPETVDLLAIPGASAGVTSCAYEFAVDDLRSRSALSPSAFEDAGEKSWMGG
jgi:hypothetical protein